LIYHLIKLTVRGLIFLLAKGEELEGLPERLLLFRLREDAILNFSSTKPQETQRKIGFSLEFQETSAIYKVVNSMMLELKIITLLFIFIKAIPF
jgi:hypothetical protein